MAIRVLPPSLINQIAAGEVVERPASVVKELVENALDAKARRIEVAVRDGGRSLIRVTDDGHGMAPEDLALCVERHATSKLPDQDLWNIASFGFRGEALPSIASVSRMTITSRTPDASHAWVLALEAGVAAPLKPAAAPPGTRIEVVELFFATPARLKFLRSEQAETAAIRETMEALALAHPAVTFHLTINERAAGRFDPAALDADGLARDRVRAILGREFADNAVPLHAERNGMVLTGFIGLPTYQRSTPRDQFLFVNGRVIRDRALTGAIKGAYADVMPRDKFPAAALFLAVPPAEVDVNVHPAKTQVRFRSDGEVRGLLVGSIKQTLATAGVRSATTLSDGALGGFRPSAASHFSGSYTPPPPSAAARQAALALQRPLSPAPTANWGFGEAVAPLAPPPAPVEPATAEPATRDLPLGRAIGQLHGLYVVAETADGLVLVDQHAAHERLLFERLKQALAEGGVAAQGLLVPDVVEMRSSAAAALLGWREELNRLGLEIEPFGSDTVLVRSVPALLGRVDVTALVRDLGDRLAEDGDPEALRRRLHEVLATIACRRAVKANDRLSLEQMDALLRQMERTPAATVCNHGRPTVLSLSLGQIEKLFAR
jgi:DNA mismatch repair protein MutL